MQCGFSWVWAEELPEALVGPSTPFSLSTPLCGWRGGRLCVCVVCVCTTPLWLAVVLGCVCVCCVCTTPLAGYGGRLWCVWCVCRVCVPHLSVAVVLGCVCCVCTTPLCGWLWCQAAVCVCVSGGHRDDQKHQIL